MSVNTSLGTVSGSETLPGTITAINTNVEDTLALGQPLTISWNTDAQLNYFRMSYEWLDEEDNWDYTAIDTFLTTNSITLDGSLFTHNGYIYYFWIEPVNGPFPEPGAIANMSGNGSGFLYYFSDRAYNESMIIVGSGWGSNSKQNFQQPPEMEINSRIRKKIESMFNLNSNDSY